jgi:DNA repair protein RecN (Recombination protein N)
MLALKHVLKRDDRVSVLVFDEIDANVGGRLAAVVGHKLRELAERQQVLCITHLPQIASYANRHLSVRKQQRGGETRTTIHVMSGDDRLEELAAMIGGKSVSATARAQARELLEVAAADVAVTSPAATKRRRRRAS